MSKYTSIVESLTPKAFWLFACCVPISLALQNIGFAVALLISLLGGHFWHRREMVLSNSYTVMLLVFLTLLMVGVFYSYASWDWRLHSLKKQGELLLILPLLAAVPNNKEFLYNIIKAYVTGAMVVVIIAWLGVFNSLPNMVWFAHPAPYYVFFKIYGAMFMAFAAYLTLFLMHRHWQQTSKWFWLVCFVLITYNVLWQSLSRTGYIVYFLTLFLFIAQNFKGRLLLLTLALFITLLGVSFLTSSVLQQGVSRAVNNAEKALHGQVRTSTGIRYEYLQNSLTLVHQKPLFGWGTGSYKPLSVTIKGITASGSIANKRHQQTTPENTYYRTMVENGLVGLIALLLLWGWQVWRAMGYKDSDYQQLALTFMATMIVASMSQDLLLDESPRLFYILFTSVLFAPTLVKTAANE